MQYASMSDFAVIFFTKLAYIVKSKTDILYQLNMSQAQQTFHFFFAHNITSLRISFKLLSLHQQSLNFLQNLRPDFINNATSKQKLNIL